jgi:hypothetical protein
MIGGLESRKLYVRLFLLALVVPSTVYLVGDLGIISASGGSAEEQYPDTVSAAELEGATIIASQTGSLSVASPEGETIARISKHDSYFDVDRVESVGSATVLYAAVDYIPKSECAMRTKCVRNTVETYNLTTGETETLFAQTIPDEKAPQWHDADLLDDGDVIVADMARDRVFIVDPATGLINWQWQAGQAFSLDSGRDNFQDWTHLNDVTVLEDGRIMVSMRNQDQVIFINRTEGVDESMTLGTDREPSAVNRTLYAQHNPDYIPAERGGPAILVADSEQDRIVEFQRNGSRWEQSWEYKVGLGWPRDADRLPNGHTLITDTHNRRVIEVDENNDVVWEASAPLPYDAERFGTGQESAGGESAERLGLTSVTRSVSHSTFEGRLKEFGRRLFPDVVVNTVAFVLAKYPISALGLAAALVGVPALFVWIALELRWSPYSLALPVRKETDDGDSAGR